MNLLKNQFICDFIKGTVQSMPDIEDNNSWESIYQAALRHHVEPYLYYRFKNKKKLLPPGIMNLLQKRYYTVATANVRFYHELAKILKCLGENNIPVILLKGAYLAAVVYENQSLRAMTDLDLLIAKSDLGKSVKALESIGFYLKKSYSQEALDKTQIHIPALEKNSSGNGPTIYVELHWSIFRPKTKRHIDICQLWERAIKININGIDTLALSTEDNIHHLSVHTSCDDLFGNGLLSLLDIVKLTEANSKVVNWDKLRIICQQTKTERYVFLTLYLAKDLLGAKVPDDFLDQMQPDDFSPEIVKFAKDMLYRLNDKASSKAEFIGRTLGGSVVERTKNFFRKFFPIRAELSEIYGKAPEAFIIWLYYPVRWKDVLFRYISVSYQILSGNQSLKTAAKLGVRGKQLATWLAS